MPVQLSLISTRTYAGMSVTVQHSTPRPTCTIPTGNFSEWPCPLYDVQVVMNVEDRKDVIK